MFFLREKVRLRLFALLEQMMEEIGGPKLMISKDRNAVKAEVLISFDGTKIPCQVVSGIPVPLQSFYAEDAHSVLSAEHKCIMEVTEHLRKTYTVEIVDISTNKIILCQAEFNDTIAKVERLSSRMFCFLQRYKESVGHLSQLAASSGKQKYDITIPLNEMTDYTLSSIKLFEEKLSIIDQEKNGLYNDGSANLSKNTLKVHFMEFKLVLK